MVSPSHVTGLSLALTKQEACLELLQISRNSRNSLSFSWKGLEAERGQSGLTLTRVGRGTCNVCRVFPTWVCVMDIWPAPPLW